MARASLATQTRRINMAIRMLRQDKAPRAIWSALKVRGGLSHRQAYRYLRQAQSNLQLRPFPAAKSVFTVNLPRRLIQQVRRHCRQAGQPISQMVAQALQRWLDDPPDHG